MCSCPRCAHTCEHACTHTWGMCVCMSVQDKPMVGNAKAPAPPPPPPPRPVLTSPSPPLGSHSLHAKVSAPPPPLPVLTSPSPPPSPLAEAPSPCLGCWAVPAAAATGTRGAWPRRRHDPHAATSGSAARMRTAGMREQGGLCRIPRHCEEPGSVRTKQAGELQLRRA